MTEPLRMTKDERITRLEAEVQTLKLQIRTLLHSHQSSIEQAMKVTEILSETVEAQVELERKFHRHLVARQAQLVLDSMDDEGMPTFEDVWDHDVERLGLPYGDSVVLVEDPTVVL